MNHHYCIHVVVLMCFTMMLFTNVASVLWMQDSNSPLPAIGYARAVYYGGRFYRVFGTDPFDTTNAVYMHDVDLDKWTELYTVGITPFALAAGSAQLYEGTIYYFGGHSGIYYKNNLYKFSIDNRSWSSSGQIGTPPSSRAYHSAAMIVVDGSARWYIWGGKSGSTLYNDMKYYEFSTNTWFPVTQTGDIPSVRYSANLVSYGTGSLYLISGVNGSAGSITDMYHFNVSTNVWTLINTNTPDALCSGAYFIESDMIFSFGGYPTNDFMYAYRINTSTWNMVWQDGDAPSERFSPAFAYVNDMKMLWLNGGRTSDSVNSYSGTTHRMYLASVNCVLPVSIPTGYAYANNGSCSNISTNVGATCDITCDTAHGYIGSASDRVCLSTGRWSATSGCTMKNCWNYSPPQGYVKSSTCSTTTFGSECYLECAEGYLGTATPSSVECTVDGWTSVSGCTIMDCGPYAPTEEGYVNSSISSNSCSSSTFGSKCYLDCAEGYEGYPSPSSVECTVDGWTTSPLSGCSVAAPPHEPALEDTSAAGGALVLTGVGIFMVGACFVCCRSKKSKRLPNNMVMQQPVPVMTPNYMNGYYGGNAAYSNVVPMQQYAMQPMYPQDPALYAASPSPVSPSPDAPLTDKPSSDTLTTESAPLSEPPVSSDAPPSYDNVKM